MPRRDVSGLRIDRGSLLHGSRLHEHRDLRTEQQLRAVRRRGSTVLPWLYPMPRVRVQREQRLRTLRRRPRSVLRHQRVRRRAALHGRDALPTVRQTGHALLPHRTVVRRRGRACVQKQHVQRLRRRRQPLLQR